MKLCKIGIHLNTVDVKHSELDCYDQIEWEVNRHTKDMYDHGLFSEILAGIETEMIHAKMYYNSNWSHMTVKDRVCLDCGKCWHNTNHEKQIIRLYVKKYIESATDRDKEQELAKAILNECKE